MTTFTVIEKTIKAGNHILTLELVGNRGTVRANGKALCMGSISWQTVVDAVAAGKFDEYIKNYCK